MTPPRTTPLDDFLAGASSRGETGETLQRLGLIGSLGGIVLATGLLVFLATVHRGPGAEVHRLARIASAAGGVAVVGAVVEVAGVAALTDVSWSDALTSSSGSAPMMRLLAGVLIALGLVVDVEPAADAAPDGSSASHRPDADVPVRWRPAPASAFAPAGAALGVVSFGFDGHTVTEGQRILHAAVNAIHVTAGSIWFGGVVGLVVVVAMRRRSAGGAGALVVRFSSLATVALLLVAVAGTAMSLTIVDGVGDYTGTAWGRALIVKVAAVSVAAAIGAYHHVKVVPALEPAAAGVSARTRVTLTIQSVVLAGVVIASAVLAGASTR